MDDKDPDALAALLAEGMSDIVKAELVAGIPTRQELYLSSIATSLHVLATVQLHRHLETL